MSDSYYSQRIYDLLNEYLPKIDSWFEDLDNGVSSIQSTLTGFVEFLDDYKVLLLIIAAVLLLGRFVSKEWLS